MLIRKSPHRQFITRKEESSFVVRAYRKKKFDFFWHYHPEIEITWIKQGSGVRYIGSSLASFQAGDLCWISENVPHTYASETHPKTEASWVVLQWTPPLFGESFWKLSEIEAVRRILLDPQKCFLFSGEKTAKLGEKLEKMAQEGGGRVPLSTMIGFLEELARCPKKDLHDTSSFMRTGSTMDLRINRLLTWIHQNSSKNISQKEAADFLKLSPSSFSRFFRNRTQRTFQDYLNEVRVINAKLLLRETSKSVTQIAFDVGYNNLSNFNRRFKELSHFSPREFRRCLL